jgi:hypothetical protein
MAAGGWRGCPSVSQVAPQLIVEAVERAVLLPVTEVSLHRLSRWKIVGQGSPLAAGAVDVQQSVDDLTAFALGGAATRFGCRDESFDLNPLRIGQVAGVRLSCVHVRLLLQLPGRLSQRALSRNVTLTVSRNARSISIGTEETFR